MGFGKGWIWERMGGGLGTTPGWGASATFVPPRAAPDLPWSHSWGHKPCPILVPSLSPSPPSGQAQQSLNSRPCVARCELGSAPPALPRCRCPLRVPPHPHGYSPRVPVTAGGAPGGRWQGPGSPLSTVSQQKQDADDEEELEIAVDNTAFMDEFFSEVREGWEQGWGAQGCLLTPAQNPPRLRRPGRTSTRSRRTWRKPRSSTASSSQPPSQSRVSVPTPSPAHGDPPWGHFRCGSHP